MREFFVENERRILFGAGVFIVAIISAELGAMMSRSRPEPPLIVEKPIIQEKIVEVAQSEETKDSTSIPAKNIATEKTAEKTGTVSGAASSNPSNPMQCPFVGSKNGTKYYPPTCSYAKRLKPENVVCFQSDEDAQKRGYSRSTGCKYNN